MTTPIQTAGNWIEIFRVGDFGAKGKFTPEDLDRVVASYDPSFHEAPVVVGHPKDNAPAYGWIEAIKRDGDKLLCRERQVDPQFHDARSAGRYKKRSASFYTNAAGRIAALRHVGYLGAMPPEVKGLRDVKFSDEGKQFTEVDFEEDAVEKSLAEQISDGVKDFFAKTFGGTTPKSFSESDVTRIATEAAAAAAAPLQTKITELETKLGKQTTDFAELQRKAADGSIEARAGVAVGRLKAAGKWIPAYEKMGVPLVFAELATLSTTVEFGEEEVEGKKRAKKVSGLDVFASFLEGLPKIVPEGRMVAGTVTRPKGSAVNFTEGRAKADPNSIALNDAIEARVREKNISFSEAMDQVTREHPELCQPGNAMAGAV